MPFLRPFSNNISISDRYANGTLWYASRGSSIARFKGEKIVQVKIISQSLSLVTADRDLLRLGEVLEPIFREGRAFREKAVPHVITEDLRGSLSLIGYNEGIPRCHPGEYLSLYEVSVKPSSLAGNQRLGIVPGGDSIGVGGPNGTPQKYDLEGTDDDQQTCKDHKGYIPFVLFRLDRYWGSGSDSYSLLVTVGSYAGSWVALGLGCLTIWKTRRLLGAALIGLGVWCDCFGTFVLGTNWNPYGTDENGCESHGKGASHIGNTVTQCS